MAEREAAVLVVAPEVAEPEAAVLVVAAPEVAEPEAAVLAVAALAEAVGAELEPEAGAPEQEAVAPEAGVEAASIAPVSNRRTSRPASRARSGM